MNDEAVAFFTDWIYSTALHETPCDQEREGNMVKLKCTAGSREMDQCSGILFVSSPFNCSEKVIIQSLGLLNLMKMKCFKTGSS